MLLYSCQGCTPFSLLKEEISKLITSLVVRIHNRICWTRDLGPYTKQPEYTHPKTFWFTKPQIEAFVQFILDKNSKIPWESSQVKTCQLTLRNRGSSLITPCIKYFLPLSCKDVSKQIFLLAIHYYKLPATYLKHKYTHKLGFP